MCERYTRGKNPPPLKNLTYQYEWDERKLVERRYLVVAK